MSTPFLARHIHVAMAGNGQPYRYLTPVREQLLAALGRGSSISQFSTLFQLSPTELQAELAPLIDARLLEYHNETYNLTFFSADHKETQRVVLHAHSVGLQLERYLEQHWNYFIQLFNQINLDASRSFVDMAFFLVGDRLLDVGLLDTFSRISSLMPPAPARPTPEHPEARYYFWMIEGDYDQRGKYGQRSIKLPDANSYVFTFGQYKINNHINAHRQQFEQMVINAIQDEKYVLPRLAEAFTLPYFSYNQSLEWTKQTRTHMENLVAIYEQNRKDIYTLYKSLRSSQQPKANFGEFFCWYDHVAYSYAIDELIKHGRLYLPENHYVAAIWYEDPHQKEF